MKVNLIMSFIRFGRGRRGLPLLALALLLLSAACSGNVRETPGGQTGANGTADATANETANQETDTKPAGEANRRVIEHAGGQTVLEDEPKKIAVLDYRLADTLLALGIIPHAMGTYLGETDLPYIDGSPLAKVVPLGDSVNMESLIDSEPDLIIARSTDTLENLQKIAPTIVVDKADNWREGLREVGRYLDREAEAEAWLAEFDREAAELREELGKRAEPDATFLYLRVMPKEVRVHGVDQALSQTLFGELGLKPVPGLENVKRIEVISLEALPDFDADYIFMEVGTPGAGGDQDAKDNLKGLQETMVWKGLNAVRHDRVYEVPQWIISDFPHIKLKSLEIIREALLGK
ncbi:ABC transporter substrate-binding protein [Paenibacillus harenae]|uniref:ABC transporter substrate-binding protein n=1 Tax=Paenibacillus harenae TaxID=306543 RepID=UPI00041EE5E2|nr:ABC transporter substrate-binding protein [Paenibacillus harenae]